MRVALLLLSAISLPGFAGPAPAENPASPPANAAAKPAEAPAPVIREIVVTGQRPDVETRVDRKIYAVSHDLQANLGSAADVLGNIPSVSVDIDGNPSLRGNADVQIFIDGRPAPEFNGSGRGAALQQLDADNIDRIEILTNPPANYKREGSGGIINIVTKRSAHRSASARASVGTAGRYNAGTRQAAQLGKLNLHASASVRRDLRIRDITDLRIVRDEAQSILSDRRQRAAGDDDRLSKTVSLGADYELSDVDRLSAAGTFYRRDADAYLQENNLFLDANGGTAEETTRIRRAAEFEYNSSAELRFHHQGPGENGGDGLNVGLQRSESKEWRPLRKTSRYFVPPQTTTFENQDFLEDEVVGEFDIDYTATLASGAKIVSGYDFEDTSNYFDVLQTLPVNAGGALVPDPNFTNRFRYAQTIHALYSTYEWPIGDWTVLAGLRLEQTDIDIRQVTTDERSRQDYFRAYPSLHFANKLNEQQALTFNYARRVDRPYWQSMNPFRIQQSEFSITGGNPLLKPSEVDSLEAGWSYDQGKTSLGATLFARRNRNNLEFVTTPISPTVVVQMPQNVGVSDSGGLELAASGRLLPQLDCKLSGEAFYYEVDATNLGIAKIRSAFAYEAKSALNWRMTAADSAQINFTAFGKWLTPQGYQRNGGTWVDLGFRHQFRPEFSVSVTATDVFASRRFRSVTDTAELSSTTTIHPVGRIFFVGVSWSLAAKKEPAENFEYDN